MRACRIRRIPGVFCLLLLVIIAAASPLRSQEGDWVRSVLARPILRADEALTDVRDYCEARVPRMPALRSRAEWERYAARMRARTLDRVVFRGEAARWRKARCRVEWLGTMEGGPGYRIRKLRFESVPGLWVPALLYEPERLTGKVPV